MGNVLTELEKSQNQQQNRRPNRSNSIEESSQNDNLPKLPFYYPSLSWEDIEKENFQNGKSTEDQSKQLQKGVYWDNRKKKYWVDNKGNNCFKVFANGLKITWSDNPNYWYLHKKSEDGDDNITIAQLRNVAWLEVHGSFKGADLTPDVTYQVSFIIKLERTCYGWEVPVNFSLKVPEKEPTKISINFKSLEKEKWILIQIGKFESSKQLQKGDVDFSLYEYDGGSWKRGLIIKGVLIKPI